MKRYLVLLIALAVAVLCAGLGMWQVRRMNERRALNDLLERRSAMPPLRMGSHHGDSLHFRRIIAKGEFDFERQLVVVARSHGGVPAVHVVTPLDLDAGGLLLVERGWVPSPDGMTVDLAALDEPSSTTVQGLAIGFSEPARIVSDSGWPRRVMSPSPVGLAGVFEREVPPVVLRRLTLPAHSPTALRTLEMPALERGPHLSYAVQWFSFAMIALVGGGILARRTSEARAPVDLT